MYLKKTSLLNVLFAASISVAPVLAADTGSDTKQFGSVMAASPAIIADAEGADSWREHKRLSLSDDQLEKMNSLKNQYLDSIGPKEAELKVLKRQLHSVFLKQSVDRVAALSIQSRISAIKGDLATARLNHRVDMMNELTPEQREHLRHHLLAASVFGGFDHHRCAGPWHHGHEMGGHEWMHHAGGPERPERPERPEGPVSEAAPDSTLTSEVAPIFMIVSEEVDEPAEVQ